MGNEVLEGINRRNKLFQKFKRSGLYDDNVNYKKARNDVHNLIKNKKRKTLRTLGAPSKVQSMSTFSLKKEKGNLYSSLFAKYSKIFLLIF